MDIRLTPIERGEKLLVETFSPAAKEWLGKFLVTGWPREGSAIVSADCRAELEAAALKADLAIETR